MAKVFTEGLPLTSARAFLERNGFGPEAEDLDAPVASPFIRRAKRGEALEVLRAHGLLEKFISECWPTGTTAIGQRKMDWYDRCYRKRLGLGSTDKDEEDEPVSDAEEVQIVEMELQNYLANNLGVLEPGMTLWKFAGGQSPVEFPVDEKRRRIDILARDKSGNPVVIELKASRGHERVIGQALYYRECVKEKLNAPKVRTFIVAREITDEVRIAARAVPDVELFEYKLSMTLAKI